MCCKGRGTCASGEVHRVCTYACCGCGDSSSCAVSAVSVVVYIATLLAEFWELASDAHAAPASMAEYTFSFCGVCGTRSTCTQRQQHRQVIVFVASSSRKSWRIVCAALRRHLLLSALLWSGFGGTSSSARAWHCHHSGCRVGWLSMAKFLELEFYIPAA